ncbi:endonuclease domain-containing protein [Altererythrobacter sp. Root672]|uniref:endonuclease domain-containing protein n=1 Tax=Altererythrobacter sp. Root672 TaxID=1736584 RepID=UPI0009EC93CA|nr:DUF559 domain-containing protein [Altererythrobacter sp. Root672]
MFKGIAPKPKAGGVRTARGLRKAISLPEVLLWQRLRQRPYGLKFRCQHPTGPFVLDFFCSDARLAIEVDGYARDNAERATLDRGRDLWLDRMGVETVRIPARDVLSDSDAAVEALVEFARARLPLHHPAAPGGPPPRASSGRI